MRMKKSEKMIIKDSIGCMFIAAFIVALTLLTIGFNILNLIHTYKYGSILILVLPVEQAFFTASISTALYFFDYKKVIIYSDKLILIRRFHKQLTLDKEQVLISKKYIIVKLTNLTTKKNWYFVCCKFSSKNYHIGIIKY